MFCKGRTVTKCISDSDPFRCKGVVEGQFVNDIVLDTGCSRTLVRSDLVGEENCKPGEKVTVQCAHGDIVTYPVASVELEVQGRVLTVEAAVSNQLPSSMLLGTDVPGLSELLQSKSVNTALMAVTRSQTKRSQAKEANLREVSSMYKDTTPPVLTHEEDTIQGEDKRELGELESEPEKTASAVEAAEPRVTSPVVPHNNNWCEEYNFDAVMFIDGKNKKKVSRSEKREARYNHAKTQNIVRSGFNLDISKPELRKLQDEDPMIQELKAKNPEVIEERNGLWYHLWKPRQHPEKIVEQLLLPKQYYQVICKLAHTIPLAGHLGRDKTVKRITRHFYWPSVFRDVADYCKSCPECQRTGKGRLHKVPLVPLPVMQEPFERIAMDIVGPLPRSKRGNQYILVVCDYATRYPEAMAIRKIDAGVVAEKLIQMFSRVGIPREILSHQGTNFMSQLLKELYNLLHIHPIRTSPYHPQTDGLVERFNKTLKSLLRKFVKKQGRDWDMLQ